MAQRVDRLADQAGGGSMVTTKSLASFDGEEDEGEVLQRLNVILKVSDMKPCLKQIAVVSVTLSKVCITSLEHLSAVKLCVAFSEHVVIRSLGAGSFSGAVMWASQLLN